MAKVLPAEDIDDFEDEEDNIIDKQWASKVNKV